MAVALQRALWRELLNVDIGDENPGEHNRQCRHTAYTGVILYGSMVDLALECAVSFQVVLSLLYGQHTQIHSTSTLDSDGTD